MTTQIEVDLRLRVSLWKRLGYCSAAIVVGYLCLVAFASWYMPMVRTDGYKIEGCVAKDDIYDLLNNEYELRRIRDAIPSIMARCHDLRSGRIGLVKQSDVAG